MKIEQFLNKLYADTSNESALEIKYPDPVPTPSPALNWALSGGTRPGVFYLFEGPESSGKSFIALCCVAELLRRNPEGVAFWFDVEKTFSDYFAAILLPDPKDRNRLVVHRSDTGPSIFDYFRDTVLGMVEQGMQVVACVIDSLNAIQAPKEANAKSTADFTVGDLSAYLPKAFRAILHPCKPRLKEGFCGIPWFFISQVRDNLDPNAKYTGEKYTIPGGWALKHFVEVEILFEIIQARDAKIFDDSVKNMNDQALQTGHRVRAKIKKSKIGGPPKRVAEFDFMYDRGIVNQETEIANLGINLGIITKEGNTHYFDGQKLAVGEDATIKVIAANKDLQDSIVAKIMGKSKEEFDVKDAGSRRSASGEGKSGGRRAAVPAVAGDGPEK